MMDIPFHEAKNGRHAQLILKTANKTEMLEKLRGGKWSGEKSERNLSD